MYQLWSQDNFSKGELSPYMYARAQVNQYYDGLKKAQNVLTYPTGAAGKRFGTLFQNILRNTVTASSLYFQTFQYLDECVYQLIFSPLNLDIYLEGLLQANVTTTLDATDIANLSTTTIGSTFRVAGQGFAPYDLTRYDLGTAAIVGVVGGQLSITPNTLGPLGTPYPVVFTTSGTLPTTTPQIKIGVTYFAATTTSLTAISVYSSAYDAKFNINPFTITSAGTSSNVQARAGFTWQNTIFTNLPFFDFNGGYDSITFTLSALSGNSVTLTASSTIFNLAFVGGAFFGAGGSSRITGYTNGTTVTISIQETFDSSPITGSLCVLAEPAWSDSRGWPQICSSYQNRALFANTESLPNGFYASVVNEYPNFGDLTGLDGDAISWYPSSNDVNVIRFIVPFRSITVHTNSGIYSSPLSEIAAITPSTFTLQLQDSTPATVLQPQAIDNQIIVVSGNDVHTMLWDGINNAYTSNIVSIVSEQVIRNPVDETSFADLRRAGSRYVFIVNESGSMAVYQTLQAESVSGFTPQIMEQSYGVASFLQVASSFDGRCWFVCQRQIASAASGIAVSGFTPYSAGPPIVLSTLTATSSNFSTTAPTAITFTTSGTLPATVPPLAVATYYWAIGVTANTFNVYLDQADAMAGTNALSFTSAGTSSDVVAWPLATIYTLEELTQETRLDCAVYYNSTATDTINTGVLFNAQTVKMVGSLTANQPGFGFDAIGVSNEVVFESHGSTVAVEEAYIGFPINMIIEPMPLAPPPGQQTSLTKPKHVRSIRFMFNNTIGGTINGVPIALSAFDEAEIGQPPFPARGIFEIMPMGGWDDFKQPSFTIEHNEPFNIELIGVFYSVDT